ncbi:hypothetical protein H310_13603 [Aphanomyces invadans]|uniref:Carboxypeptidase n=1 Tax=Aphanomyces invadans TaxID=157072 RepID=A0A024TD92_9STRA|nr:hypothetical protein H310_13603 [Aphanomyces invadans]ETV91954.1 hypothetical protein H310_13603 [Aphanomyces invadans]|eukprot:XP_008879378.1 hypothetical protein H310_13603 [Aphanomyces invadans]
MFRACAIATTALVASAWGDSTLHKITSLPGYNDPKPINFDQYAGLIALPSNGQKMFYWLVESESSPSTDPLVLWLNGGPGCSSLGGFFTELGPFVVQSDMTVKRNPYAWNRKANMVFLDSPAGVGFSQPVLNASDYHDDVTAARSREFLEQFLALYPQYTNRDFYITGESYAGMYIPFLVHQLVTEPVAGLHLTGFAIGNPYTDQKIDGKAYMDYYYTHGLISIETYRAVERDCKPTEWWLCQFNHPGCSSQCAATYDEAVASVDLEDLNPYYIYGDVCLLQGNQSQVLKYHDVRPLTHRGKIQPCTDSFTTVYLNQPSVVEAIHATGGTTPWSDCNPAVSRQYTLSLTSLDKYPTILAAGLKALIYSGDADAIVNFLGTQRWLATDVGLNLTATEKWSSWFGPDKQLAGYTETYGNVTFKTVKGAGHMVPATRPLHGLYMFECFLYSNRACTAFAYPKDPSEYLSGADLTAPEQDNRHVEGAVWWWVGIAAAVAVGIAVCVVVFKSNEKSQYAKLNSSPSKPTH